MGSLASTPHSRYGRVSSSRWMASRTWFYWRRNNAGSAFWISNTKPPATGRPVSYTHLDVYKRQALGISSPSKVFGRIAAQTIEGFVREFQANSDIANAVSRSMEAAVGAATEELARGSLSVALQPPVTSRATANASLTTRSAEPGAASTFAGRSGTFNLYGNIVLNNVSDARSFLEELDALRGGGQ